jgi:peptidylprolyl isomerase
VFAAKELATVNGKPITDKDLDLALSGFTQVQKGEILKDSESKKQVLNNLVDQEVMIQIATKKGLENSPEYKTALEGFRKQYLSNLLIEKVKYLLTRD